MERENWSVGLKCVLILILIISFNPSQAQKSTVWTAPKTADALKNPLKDDPAAVLEGKKVYTATCAICHGESGKGNGAASVALEPHPANFLTLNIKNESDGAIFWKMTEGRPPMATYKTLLTEQQRWQLVTYIRALETKK